MKAMFNSSISRATILVLLFCAIVSSQVGYDVVKVSLPPGTASSVSPEFVRLVDMGFHGAAASFLWIPTMPEVLGIYFEGSTQYLADLDYVNSVDPKLSYPYAFSVLTLPALVRLPNRDAVASAIGARGLANADPDWRLPYYLAAHYYLDLNDMAAAAQYYDLVARTPGIPAYAARFALNFDAMPDTRAKAEALWASIYETTNDEVLKQRAAEYVARLEMFDALEAAARAYKLKYGAFPATLEDLVSKGILAQLPQDPFGFTFQIESDGTVGLDLTKMPEYLK
jgi:hypothetical protein